MSLFERALAIDPRSVEAQSFLAISLTGRVLAGMSDSRADDLSRAGGLIGQTLSAAPASGFAHFAKGQLLRAQHRCAAAIQEFEAVLAVNRNSAAAIARVGYCKLRIGSPEEAISVIEKAIRISPRDPQLGVWYFWIGQAYLLQSRLGDAVAWPFRPRSAVVPTLPNADCMLPSMPKSPRRRQRRRKGLGHDRRSAADFAGQHYPRRDGRPIKSP